MNRHALTLTLALGLISALGGTTLMADAPSTHATTQATATMPFEELFAKSLAEKKGLTIYVAGGHTIALVVTEITPDVIKGRSQQFSEIQVLRREVVAVAMS